MSLVTLVCLLSIAASDCSVATAARVDVSQRMGGGLCMAVARVLAGDRALPPPDGGYLRFECLDDDELAAGLIGE